MSIFEKTRERMSCAELRERVEGDLDALCSSGDDNITTEGVETIKNILTTSIFKIWQQVLTESIEFELDLLANEGANSRSQAIISKLQKTLHKLTGGVPIGVASIGFLHKIDFKENNRQQVKIEKKDK